MKPAVSSAGRLNMRLPFTPSGMETSATSYVPFTGDFSMSAHLFPLNSCQTACSPFLAGAASTAGTYSLLTNRVFTMSPFFPFERTLLIGLLFATPISRGVVGRFLGHFLRHRGTIRPTPGNAPSGTGEHSLPRCRAKEHLRESSGVNLFFKLQICHCAHLSLSFHKIGCGSAMSSLKTAFSFAIALTFSYL